MENLHYVVIFSAVVSVVFFVLSSINSKQDDEGNASVYLTIGILLVIVTIILFLIMVNVNHLYEQEQETLVIIKNFQSNSIS